MADILTHLIPPAANDGAATPNPLKQKWKDMGDGTYAQVLAVDASSLPSTATPLAGGTNNIAAGTTTYFRLGADAATGSGGGSDPTDLANGNVEDAWVAGVAGTISGLRTYSNLAPGAGESYTLTLIKNAAAQTLAVAYGPADVAKDDTANSFTVAVGDRVAVRVVSSGGAASTKFSWGLKFVPS